MTGWGEAEKWKGQDEMNQYALKSMKIKMLTVYCGKSTYWLKSFIQHLTTHQMRRQKDTFKPLSVLIWYPGCIFVLWKSVLWCLCVHPLRYNLEFLSQRRKTSKSIYLLIISYPNNINDLVSNWQIWDVQQSNLTSHGATDVCQDVAQWYWLCLILLTWQKLT